MLQAIVNNLKTNEKIEILRKEIEHEEEPRGNL